MYCEDVSYVDLIGAADRNNLPQRSFEVMDQARLSWIKEHRREFLEEAATLREKIDAA